MGNSHPGSATHEGRRRGILGWTCAAALGGLLFVGGSARALIPPAAPIGIIPATPIGIVLDEVDILLEDLQTNGGSKGQIKKATKMEKQVQKAAATDSLVKQLKAFSSAAKAAEKLEIPSTTPIGEALVDVAVVAEGMLEGARADGGLMIPSTTPIGIVPAAPIGKRRKDPVRVARKAVSKGTKFLDKADAQALLSKKFKQWAKAAKAMDDFVAASHGNTMNWVVSSVAVAAADEGFDMDGDGTADNAAAELVAIVAALPGLDEDTVTSLLRTKLEEQRNAALVPIIQMWGFEAYSNDSTVFGGLMNGVDCDDDTSDNYSGAEEFDVSQGQASDGHPFVRAMTSFDSDGDYTLVIDGTRVGQFPTPAGFEFAGLALPGDVPFGVIGNASENANDGLIAFALPLDALVALLDSELPTSLPAPAEAAIRALADLDVDGDGTNESMSTALLFESVPCGTNVGCDGGGTSITANWVISEVSVAGVGEGEDFTGDGVPDNALAELLARIATDFPLIAAQIDFDQFLNDWIAASNQVAMIQIWGIDDWNVDSRVYGGVFNADDTDGNAADNFSGTEAFDPGATVDAQGHPVVRVPDEFAPNGRYEIHLEAADLAAAPIQLGLLPVSNTAEFFLAGTAAPTTNSGQLAFTVDPANITQILDDHVALPLPQALEDLIAGFADVPGGLLSVTIDFQSVSANLR